MNSALKELIIELGRQAMLTSSLATKLGKTQPKCSRNQEGEGIVGEMAWENFATGSGL